MLKTITQLRFDSLVAKTLWPEFKAKGYRKTGNNFRLYNISGWGKILNVQKSSSSSKDNISFTINTGVYLVKADTMFESAKEERFLEPDCLVRKRIGQLNRLNKDLWYELNEQTPLGELEIQVMRDTTSFIIPYLELINSEADILNQIIKERSPKSEQAIRTLFTYGYSEEGNLWLKEEIASTTSTQWRRQLMHLQKLFN